MFVSLIDGLGLIFAWPAFAFLLLGVVFGLWLGAVPGLGGIIGVVIILPFTFDLGAIPSMALILGVFAVTATSDTIASVMLGIPGTAASQATIMDGYPMAQNGQAARAFGAAFSASAIGGVLGGLAMAASLPVIKPLILSFGTPEFFLLGLLGLTMVATVSGAAISKGMAAAALGLMLSQIGFPVASEGPRYWFNILYLIDGLPLVPLVLGLFAIPEVMELAVRDRSISKVPESRGPGIIDGIRDTLRNRGLVLRCSAIGIYIGTLPGLGGMIADWVAYGHAVQSGKSSDGPDFGKGQVRGVIAPEAANNAVLGGALIPTVGLGIPGSASMAILLGAFVISGLTPGRAMLTTQLDVTFALVWMLILANIIGAALLMLWSRQVARVSFLNGHYIVPAVLVFVFMGAWMQSPDIANWIVVFAMGVVGFIMKRCGWPRPALVLGFVLGPIMENAAVLAVQTFTLSEVLTRPLTLVLIVVLIGAFLLAIRSARRARALGAAEDPTVREGGNPALSLAFGLICLGLLAAAIPPAFDWPFSARLFPLAIAPAGMVLLALAIHRDGRLLWRKAGAGTGLWRAASQAFSRAEEGRSVHFLLWVVALIGLTPVLGQRVALLLFVPAYLFAWGRFRPLTVLLYTAGVWGLIELLYDQILNTRWLPSILFG